MTWLREIDRIYGTIEEHSRAFGEVQLIRRMARALRELAGGLKLYDRRMTLFLDASLLDTEEAHQALQDIDAEITRWEDNLSTDAKELTECPSG